ncbi:hypothetical protein [Rhizobium sp. TRM95796]|uniref:hypothetical protein n=1 Tax=Rhizobium sp. TRM95796 TaxID=2979862 RepID=UPI0021E99715|nr:hypothetical protein [Rhizobium sp. TRM95796]MCV3765089.1 hypothetical protein [Rhizobium sp. TRM95796]
MARTKKKLAEALEASTVLAGVSKSDMPPAKEVVLTEQQEWELEDAADKIRALGRRTTEQAFALGEQLARAQAILPPKRFGAWVKKRCGYTTKWAKNYTSVYHKLTRHKETLEIAAAPSTLMFALAASHDDGRVDDVVAMIARGEPVTAAKAKDMLQVEKLPAMAIDPLNMPGRAGFRKVAEQRVKSQMTTFYALLDNVLGHVESAVARIKEGKRVIKSELAAAIQYDCRHVHDLFALTMAPYYVAKEPYINWKPTTIDATTGWGQFQAILHRLGSQEQWPGREEFSTWLIEEVYPKLRFAIESEAPADAEAVSEESVEAQADVTVKSEIALLNEVDAPTQPSENVVPLTSRRRNVALVTAE